MPRLTTYGLYGEEPMRRWARQFDVLEEQFKMKERVKSTLKNLEDAVNVDKPGVANNHTLPNTFVKHYYAPQNFIYSKPADGSEGCGGSQSTRWSLVAISTA